MLRRLLFAAAMLLAASAMAAGPATYTVHLSGANGVPPIDTKAQGEFILKISGDTAYFKLIVANIENVTAAHLHYGTATENGNVVVPLFAGPTKEGRFSGILAEGTFTASDFVGPLAGKTFEEFLEDIQSGEIYVNVHTIANPKGEIRGQLP